MSEFYQKIKRWMLIIAMVTGASLYLVYHAIPGLHSAGPVLLAICKKTQPTLLFIMLYLCFSRIEIGQLRPQKWQLWLLLIQGLSFVAISLLIMWAVGAGGEFAARICENRIPIEAFMLCMITPTATACAVITGRLGGNMAGVMSYTILINLLVAVLVPTFVPLLYPSGDITFWAAFFKILAKVFPLLIAPGICAWLTRLLLPKLHGWLSRNAHLSFYVWAVSLTLAILMSTRAIVHSGKGAGLLATIALLSLVACALQFWAGRKIGGHYGDCITPGQSLGQKNTVFQIWLSYTFFDPVLSVTGGFYSIWHNIFNTWQLNRMNSK